MTSEIVISLKPQFAGLILAQNKNHEFRKYKPKSTVTRLWIYVTSPVAELKYIAEVGEVIIFPQQIVIEGAGNTEFNAGLKKARYAFPILHLDEIAGGISLQELKTRYNFRPPQSFMYMSSFSTLVNDITINKLKRIF